jgi:hypothetical protein
MLLLDFAVDMNCGFRLAGVIRLFDLPAPLLSLKVQADSQQCGDEIVALIIFAKDRELTEKESTLTLPCADARGHRTPGCRRWAVRTDHAAEMTYAGLAHERLDFGDVGDRIVRVPWPARRSEHG